MWGCLDYSLDVGNISEKTEFGIKLNKRNIKKEEWEEKYGLSCVCSGGSWVYPQ